jgi:hypothetical protein
MEKKPRSPILLPLISTLAITFCVNFPFYLKARNLIYMPGHGGLESESERRTMVFWGIIQVSPLHSLPCMLLIFGLSWLTLRSRKKAIAFTFFMWLLFMLGALLAAIAAYYYRRV